MNFRAVLIGSSLLCGISYFDGPKYIVCLSVKSPASPEIADWDGIPSIRLPAIFDELTAPPPPSRAAKRCRQNAEDAPKDTGTRRAVRGIGYRRMSSYLIFSMVTTRTA